MKHTREHPTPKAQRLSTRIITWRNRFRAGDIVKHHPSGEEWVLAYDEELGRVSACGWPESLAEANDCDLIKAATDEERIDMLTRWAGNLPNDHRTRAARRQLSTDNKTP